MDTKTFNAIDFAAACLQKSHNSGAGGVCAISGATGMTEFPKASPANRRWWQKRHRLLRTIGYDCNECPENGLIWD